MRIWTPIAVMLLVITTLIYSFKILIPLGLFVFSLWHPELASYIFIGILILFEGYIYFVDIFCKPGGFSYNESNEDILTLRKYHIAFRTPFFAKGSSIFINASRWAGLLLWAPWLFYNNLILLDVFFILHFWVLGFLALRLDPFFFCLEGARKGSLYHINELGKLQNLSERLAMRTTNSEL